MDRDDVGVVQRRSGPRLFLDAPQTLRVGRQLGGEHPDRHLAPHPLVLRPVDLSHPFPADRSQDLVGAQARPFSHGRTCVAASAVQFRTTLSGSSWATPSETTARNRLPSGDTSNSCQAVPSLNVKSTTGFPGDSEGSVRTGTEIN